MEGNWTMTFASGKTEEVTFNDDGTFYQLSDTIVTRRGSWTEVHGIVEMQYPIAIDGPIFCPLYKADENTYNGIIKRDGIMIGAFVLRRD